MKIYILAVATFCLKLVNVMFWNQNIKRNYMLAQEKEITRWIFSR